MFKFNEKQRKNWKINPIDVGRTMVYIILGVFAFFLFIVYDFNSIILKNKIINRFFFFGIALLGMSTIGLIFDAIKKSAEDFWRIAFFGLLAIVFLLLLIYTLFLALPFEETYIKETDLKKVCSRGVYALSRHPGILFFSGFYLFLWLAFNTVLLFWAGLIFSGCNLIYVFFQDRWTFMNVFEDYDKYKRETPFVIPNLKSIKRCLYTWRQEME